MTNDEKRLPLDEWLAPTSEPQGEPPRTPSLEEVHRLALVLDPDERLRLVARLWNTLPTDHRAALITLQLEDAQGSREGSEYHRPDAAIDPIWPKLKEWLFDCTQTSGLYSAPRRFDLATIFVVTAAYSLLLGGLSWLGDSADRKSRDCRPGRHHCGVASHVLENCESARRFDSYWGGRLHDFLMVHLDGDSAADFSGTHSFSSS